MAERGDQYVRLLCIRLVLYFFFFSLSTTDKHIVVVVSLRNEFKFTAGKESAVIKPFN